MKRGFNRWIVVAGLILMTSGVLCAQEVKFPRVSPSATVSQSIGLSNVTISFCRPGVKGRVIWGGLVPYDQVWRTGANEATTIAFSTDVAIEGNKLAAGTYGLFTIPGKEEWTIIFSKQATIWGSFAYDEKQDVFRIKAKPEAAPHCEWMMFLFTDLADDSAKVILQWEKLMVAFTVKVDTKAAVLGSIEKSMDNYWSTPYRAAQYAFNNDMPEKAGNWIDVSTSIKEIYWNMFLKAKIYKKMAKTPAEDKAALAVLEKAVSLIKDVQEDEKPYTEDGVKLLQEWKAPKK